MHEQQAANRFAPGACQDAAPREAEGGGRRVEALDEKNGAREGGVWGLGLWQAAPGRKRERVDTLCRPLPNIFLTSTVSSPPAGSSASARQETSSTGAAHARLLGGRLPAEHGVAEDGAWLHAHRAIFFVFLNERKFVELP